MLVSGGISPQDIILKGFLRSRESKIFVTQSPTVIAIMLGSRDLADWQAK